MALSPISWFQSLSPTLKKVLAGAVALLLALGAGYWYGRHSAPSKVIEVTDTTTTKKLQETEATLATVRQQYAELEKTKTKTKTKKVYVHDKVLTVDADTKCDETFDPATGHLAHRTCVKSKHVVDIEHSVQYLAVVNERETLKSKVSTLETENATLKQKLAEETTHTHTEKTTINNNKDRWMAGVGAGLTLNNPGMTYSAKGGYRLFGPFWLGAEVDTNKTLQLNLMMTMP